MDTFLRRLTILDFLSSSRSEKSTADILQHLVNAGYLPDDEQGTKSQLRVVQRDMKFLLGERLPDGEYDNLFGLECEQGTGRTVYWRLDPYGNMRFDYEKMPRFMALAFSMTRKHMGNILPRSTVSELQRFFDQAEERLKASDKSITRESYQRLSDSVEFYQRGQPLQAAQFDLDVLDSIYRAIVKGRQVRFEYREKSYQLHPLGVAILLPKVYLIGVKESPSYSGAKPLASALSKNDYRSFLIHKIRDVQVLEESAWVPPDFSLKKFLEAGNMDMRIDSNDDRAYSLVLRLDTNVCGLKLIDDLAGSPISHDQRLESEGAGIFILHATVHRTYQLRNWLLTLGPGVKVLNPAVIREDLSGYLREMLQAQES